MTRILIYIVAIVALLSGGYYTAYNHGKSSAKLECVENMDKYVKDVQNKIDAIESNLSTLAALGTQREEQLASDISQILAGVKKKPVTVVKNGQCNPSETFLKGIDQAIDRANRK